MGRMDVKQAILAQRWPGTEVWGPLRPGLRMHVFEAG